MRGSFHWNCPISRSPVAFAAILFLMRSRRTFSPSSRIRSNIELHGLGSSINCLGRRVASYTTRDAKKIAKLLAMLP